MHKGHASWHAPARRFDDVNAVAADFAGRVCKLRPLLPTVNVIADDGCSRMRN
jgi:alanine-alpha-ketoisovalerate/valine-pyruvate aminotransferase